MRRIWRLLWYAAPYALYSLASVVLMAVYAAMACAPGSADQADRRQCAQPEGVTGSGAGVSDPAHEARDRFAVPDPDIISIMRGRWLPWRWWGPR